jgi:uncharacterized DUF497 family protein
MIFEYDENKSASNKIKHGIDFDEAQLLWRDWNRVEIPVPNDDEVRYLTIGKIENKHWSAVITYRQSNVRLISVRHSRTKEIDFYESNRI